MVNYKYWGKSECQEYCEDSEDLRESEKIYKAAQDKDTGDT